MYNLSFKFRYVSNNVLYCKLCDVVAKKVPSRIFLSDFAFIQVEIHDMESDMGAFTCHDAEKRQVFPNGNSFAVLSYSRYQTYSLRCMKGFLHILYLISCYFNYNNRR